jgi:hypothetical protein
VGGRGGGGGGSLDDYQPNMEKFMF